MHTSSHVSSWTKLLSTKCQTKGGERESPFASGETSNWLKSKTSGCMYLVVGFYQLPASCMWDKNLLEILLSAKLIWKACVSADSLVFKIVQATHDILTQLAKK